MGQDTASDFYGAATNIGKRETQQDEFLIVEDLFEGTPRTTLFGVFDGHGSEGHRVSAFVKKLFPLVLLERRAALIGRSADAEAALKDAFATVHARLKENEAIDSYMSGSTAALLLFFEEERRVLIANVGDSRIMMGRREGED
ncbi:hypothetical protein HDU99_003684, partial [Rhizoclosmatium hyalinum]